MSKIEVNTVDVQCGSTLTLGSSGKTVTLATGASQSGFGRAGSVNWCSTIYTNSPGTVTATSGKGFFLNTTSGAITINLPSSPTVGDIVAIKDYANTFDSNAVTVGRGGSKIGGLCLDATLGTEGQSVTLIYADSTKGWLNVNTDNTVVGNTFVTATGGNAIVTCGDFKTHIFTSSGTFCVSATATSAANNVVDYLVVAGGGGGSLDYGSGGGAGGFRYFSQLSPAGSPLVAPAGITVTATSFPIAVGGGGAIASAPAANNGISGGTSTFSTISSAGGGGGAGASTNPAPSGGSGAGAKGMSSGVGGSGNTPPTSPPQGNNGGSGQGGGSSEGPGGGGGAGAVGGNGVSATSTGSGGAGSNIVDGLIGPTAPSYGEPGPVSSTRYFAGGGGGGGTSNIPGPGTGVGGVGGGGDGSSPSATGPAPAGVANTGGGGGGTSANGDGGGAGGSGVVIIRYKFQ